MIYLECNADMVLARVLTGLPKKQMAHERKGKYEIALRLRGLKKATALVDEDPGALEPPYFRELHNRRSLPRTDLLLLRDPSRDNRVVIMRPRLEEWVVRGAEEVSADLGRYGLPGDPARLHRVVNDDVAKFGRLVGDLAHTARFQALRTLLLER